FVSAVENGVYPIPGSVLSHHFLQACARSERIRERYVSSLNEAAHRVADAARHGQAAGTVRPEIDADQIGVMLVAMVMAVQTMVEVKFPLNVRSAANALKRALLTRARAS